jgi:hypothetical protein
MLPPSSIVCNAAQGFGLRRVNNQRTCAPCPADSVPLSCSSGLLARFNPNARAQNNQQRTGQWQLRLGNATSCSDFDWDDFRPEWKPEIVPRSTRTRMRVPNAPWREFQCVRCDLAGKARKDGTRCGECYAAWMHSEVHPVSCKAGCSSC